jgi:hypothetical protein
MKLFFTYLQWRKKGILLFFSVFLVFFLISLLNQVPWGVYSYAYLICIFLGGVSLAADYAKFAERHKSLQNLRQEVTLSLDRVEQGQNQIEEDYRELLEIVFRDKQKTCMEADEKYSELLEYFTMWVHQIKTPIAGMRLLFAEVEALIKQLPPECEKEKAELSARNSRLKTELFRIEQYVEMVLYYLRSGSDSTDYVLQEYNLDMIIRGAIRKYASQFISKKLSLHYSGCDKRILTDEKWLGFVVEQLLSNAVKYTEKGSVTLQVEEDRLMISDTGIGIAPEDLPRIFEKGYTGYNGRAEQKSTGIGLYLCQKILNKLGHSIAAISVPGEGTTVTLGLNRKKVEMND